MDPGRPAGRSVRRRHPTPVVGGGVCMHVLSNLWELKPLHAFPENPAGASSGGWLGCFGSYSDARVGGSPRGSRPAAPGL
jgi:hypothetical protein